MKLNNSTTLSKIKAEIQALRQQEYKHLMNNEYDAAQTIVQEIHKLKNQLLEMLNIDVI